MTVREKLTSSKVILDASSLTLPDNGFSFLQTSLLMCLSWKCMKIGNETKQKFPQDSGIWNEKMKRCPSAQSYMVTGLSVGSMIHFQAVFTFAGVLRRTCKGTEGEKKSKPSKEEMRSYMKVHVAVKMIRKSDTKTQLKERTEQRKGRPSVMSSKKEAELYCLSGFISRWWPCVLLSMCTWAAVTPFCKNWKKNIYIN